MLSICSFHFKFSPIIIPKLFEFENVCIDWLKGGFLELYGKHGKIHSHLGQYGKFTLVITLTLMWNICGISGISGEFRVFGEFREFGVFREFGLNLYHYVPRSDVVMRK